MHTSRRKSGDIPWKILSIEAALVVLSVLLMMLADLIRIQRELVKRYGTQADSACGEPSS